MSFVDITFSNKNTPGEIDGQFQFKLNDTILGLKQYVQFKLVNGSAVNLYLNNVFLKENNKTLEDYDIVTGDNIEYDIIKNGGKRKTNKRKKRKTNKQNKTYKKKSKK